MKVDRSSVKVPSSLSSGRVKRARLATEGILRLDEEKRRQRRAPIEYNLVDDHELSSALSFLRANALIAKMRLSLKLWLT